MTRFRVPFKSAMVTPLSMTMPSTWWNMGEWVASTSSLRYTRPGAMIRMGGPPGIHGAHLHGGSLAAQHDPVVGVKIEGIGPVAGGMAFVGIEPVKVVLGQLYLRTVQHFKSHADEDVLDLVQRNVHGMPVAQLRRLPGDGDIQRFRLQTCFQRFGLQAGTGLLHGLLNGRTDVICNLPHDGPLFRRQLSHLLQSGSQLALFPQKTDAQFLQRRKTVGCCNGSPAHPAG